ncbi:ROK family transcriptional regulator [Nocardioides insulae]|uniref:ROK family transcriptional regulator n=1 Tax=Nocardioides insulae TaxID=394734 RepID=UPI0004008E7A|nr:ROK family transcriptional regulator [Nocardioides insulae]
MSSAGELLELLRTGRATSLDELADLTGLSEERVARRLEQLTAAGLVLPGQLTLNPDAGVVLGVAVGRSRSQLAVFDLAGRELAGDTRDHVVGLSAPELMPQLVDRLTAMLAAVTPLPGPVLGIGMSLPGAIDPVRQVGLENPAMRGWEGVELAPYFAAFGTADGVPFQVANDAEVLARSELFGTTRRPLRNALVVKASTGIALGVLADGRVISGQHGLAGDIGHTRVDVAGQLPCRCGAAGCLETVAAGWALVKRLVDSGLEAGHVRDLAAAALAGDGVARSLLRESGRQLGDLLAVAVNLLNPQAIVLGGDMAAAFDLYSAGVRESVLSRASATATRDLVFLPATHGDSAGLVGCAALALEYALHPARVEALL